MIPSNQQLRKQLTPDICYEILMHPRNYFSIADEYVSLQKIFSRDTLLEKAELWIEMIISPLIMLCTAIWNMATPDVFQMLSLKKCFQLWKDWFRMRELRSEIHMWIQVVRSVGGPFISSNDAEYHMFVYADGMQRLHDLLIVSKERAKRL
jgi:hypothetical protein